MFLGYGLELMEDLLMAESVEESGGIEVCDPVGASNGKSTGNLG